MITPATSYIIQLDYGLLYRLCPTPAYLSRSHPVRSSFTHTDPLSSLSHALSILSYPYVSLSGVRAARGRCVARSVRRVQLTNPNVRSPGQRESTSASTTQADHTTNCMNWSLHSGGSKVIKGFYEVPKICYKVDSS